MLSVLSARCLGNRQEVKSNKQCETSEVAERMIDAVVIAERRLSNRNHSIGSLGMPQYAERATSLIEKNVDEGYHWVYWV